MKKACLTRLQPDICFVTKVAWTVACGSLFYATFAPTLPPLYAAAKAQMQVKRKLCGRPHWGAFGGRK